MKQAVKYQRHNGGYFFVDYDTGDPCFWCGLPVVAASMGGTACCPWCDVGTCRFDDSHRVDNEWDHETGKVALPRKHYAKYHQAAVLALEAARREGTA